VEAGSWDHGDDASDEVERVEHDGAGAVFPGLLEAVAQPSIAESVESLLSNRRPAEVAAESLEQSPVVASDRELGVDIETPAHGVWLVGAR
jgi:hypothetical protein